MTPNDHNALRLAIAEAAFSLSENAIGPQLVARALASDDAMLTAHGALSVETGAFTGRSPKDKFIVRDEMTADTVWWDNSGALSPAQFDVLLSDITAHLADQALYRRCASPI
jgi:phosphoenolpyruvate carboxykinase (ATP)